MQIIQIISLFVLVSTVMAQSQDGLTIFVVAMPPGWPTIFAAELGSKLKPSSNAVITWSFDGVANPRCVVNAVPNSECRGKVLDFTFADTGVKTIKATLTDGNAPPVVASIEIEITAIDKYPVAIRPEVRNVTKAQWEKYYIPAFYHLKNNGVYDHIGAIHRVAFGTLVGHRRTAVHGSPTFAPWHRALMRILERCMQEAVNVPTLGLVYMDWMKGWDGMQNYFGGNGESGSNMITDGPFCNHPTAASCARKWPLPTDFPFPEKALRRVLGADRGFTFQTQAQFDNLMAIQEYDLPPFTDQAIPGSFRSALEGWAVDGNTGFNHNGLHRWIGGTMSSVTQSFNDPVFVAHHTNVDRMFTIWQGIRRCANSSNRCYRPFEGDTSVTSAIPGATQVSSGGRTFFALPGFMMNDAMYPWSLKPFDVMLPNQGYTYLTPNQAMPEPPPPPPPPAAPTTGTPGKTASGRTTRKKSSGAKIEVGLLVFLIIAVQQII